MRGNSHVRFGKRDRQNRRLRSLYGVSVPTSRITEPSNADIQITHRLKEALNLLDIRILDHLIIGDNITSFAERGLL